MSLSFFYQSYVVYAATLIPVITGLVYYKQLNKPVKTLLLYVSVSLVINISAYIMGRLTKNNLPLLHFYTIFELVTVSVYYKRAFATKTANRWIIPIIIIYPVLCIINFSFFQSLYEFNTYTRPLGAIIIILYSGIYISWQQARLKNQQFTSHWGNWVAAGFLLYFCGSFFQFIFSNLISHYASHFVKMTIWNIHATLVIIMYLFFFKAIKNAGSK